MLADARGCGRGRVGAGVKRERRRFIECSIGSAELPSQEMRRDFQRLGAGFGEMGQRVVLGRRMAARAGEGQGMIQIVAGGSQLIALQGDPVTSKCFRNHSQAAPEEAAKSRTYASKCPPGSITSRFGSNARS